MRQRFIGLLVALFLSYAQSVWADQILVGTNEDWSGASGNINSGIVAAQAFSLNVPAQVSSVQIYLCYYNFLAGTMLIQLTDKIGSSTTAANVLAQGVLSIPLPPAPLWPFKGWVSLPTDVSITPGTYFISVGTSDGSFEWSMGESAIPVSTGVLGMPYFASNGGEKPLFPASSSFVGTGGNFGFRVEGTPVPEPATILLMTLGLAGLWLWRRR